MARKIHIVTSSNAEIYRSIIPNSLTKFGYQLGRLSALASLGENLIHMRTTRQLGYGHVTDLAVTGISMNCPIVGFVYIGANIYCVYSTGYDIRTFINNNTQTIKF